MFNPWYPRPEVHNERDSTIDQMIVSAARALETGKVTEEDIQTSLVEDRGMDPGHAANIARAARILAVKKDGGSRG